MCREAPFSACKIHIMMWNGRQIQNQGSMQQVERHLSKRMWWRLKRSGVTGPRVQCTDALRSTHSEAPWLASQCNTNSLPGHRRSQAQLCVSSLVGIRQHGWSQLTWVLSAPVSPSWLSWFNRWDSVIHFVTEQTINDLTTLLVVVTYICCIHSFHRSEVSIIRFGSALITFNYLRAHLLSVTVTL